MKVFLGFSVLFCVYFNALGFQMLWDDSPDFSYHDIFKTPNEIHVPNKLFIFPGTKWCGTGDIAKDYDDLGTEVEADKCCRTHDHCPDIINAHETKYGLKNPNFFTRLNCECDGTFYNCLKKANSEAGTRIGQMYFTALGTQCYMEFFPITGCKKYSFFPRPKCVEYNFNKKKPMMYQWFDVPNF